MISLFKKTIAFFLTLLLILGLFGCKITSAARFEPAKSLSATAQAKKGDFSFTCKAMCSSYEEVKIEFTAPQSLEGLSLTLSSDGVKVNAYGIADDFPADYISQSSPVGILLYAVRDGIFTARDFTDTGNGTYTADITVGETPVRVTYSDNGMIARIDAFSENFHAVFN